MKIKSTGSVAVAIKPKPILNMVSVVFFFSLSAFLIAAHYTDNEWVRRIKFGLIDTFSPVIELLSRPAGYMEDTVTLVHDMLDVYADNHRLKEENVSLLQWQATAAELEAENRELRNLLGLFTPQGSHYATARIVSDVHDPFSHNLVIDIEGQKEIRRGLPVVAAEGVIGHILDVQGNTAKVLLISDRQSRIPVESEKNADRGILAGINKGNILELNHMENPKDFAPGDRIVTSRSDIFPVRMVVGEVVAVEKNAVMVKPYADSKKLRFVSVLLPSKP